MRGEIDKGLKKEKMPLANKGLCIAGGINLFIGFQNINSVDEDIKLNFSVNLTK